VAASLNPLRELWERSKAWPWPTQIIVALLALAPIGGVLNALEQAPADSDTIAAPPVVSIPVPTTGTTSTAASTTIPVRASPPTTTAVAPSTTSDTTAAPVTTPPAPAATTTAAPGPVGLVAQLRIEPEHPRDGYDRDSFNYRSGGTCDTRCQVLAQEHIATLPGLPTGGWLSLYDGYTTDDPTELEVDHVVALAEAWDSGADTWDPARREAFANDLDHPGALRAVTAATNRSKSDRDPAEWQPSNRDGWCTYATDWTTTKIHWKLSADQAEANALTNMLRSC
jgi:hypothetical protein